jgi:hypothetical protein
MSSQALSERDCAATANALERRNTPKGVTVPEAVVECQGQSPFLIKGVNRSEGLAEAGGDSPVSPFIKKGRQSPALQPWLYIQLSGKLL